MKGGRTIILLMGLVFGLPLVIKATDNSEKRAKARYYYLEGAKEAAWNNPAEAYEYFKKAYSLDSSYMDAAHSYGMQRLMVRTEKLQSEEELKNTLKLLQDYVDANPTDLYAGQFYGYVTTRLDTIDEAIRAYERITDLMPEETYNLISLGDAYMMKKDMANAVKTLEKYEASEGKSYQVSLKKITYMLAGGDTIGAVKESEALIADNPKDPMRYILMGNLYEVTGHPDSTLNAFLKAEKLSPDNGSVKISLANFYKENGDSVAFDQKMYEALLSEDFLLEDKLAILSEYLQTLINEKGETSRGDYLFSVLTEQYPHESKVLDLSARYNGAKGDYAAAEEQINYAIDLESSNPAYWGQLMTYQIADSRPAEAIKTYQRAQEHIDVPESLKLLYANAASLAKDYELTTKIYEDLIHSINPDLAMTEPVTDKAFRNRLDYDNLIRLSNLYAMLGDNYYMQNDAPKAFTAYDNSLFFYPDNAMTLNNYAYFLTESGGDLDKAEKMSFQAITQSEDNPTYIDTFAWIMFKKQEYKKALEYQKKAIELAEQQDDDTAEYYQHMGDILFMNHQPADALEYWEKALKLEPDNELLRKKVEHKTFFFE